jgi:hypothetical protein
MLIKKPFGNGDVVTMKLVTGEEIITKFVEATENVYKVSKPLVLSLTQNGPAMTPFLLTAELEDSIDFSKNIVIAIVHTESGTAGQYIKGTTGIEPATTTNFGKLI